MTRRDVLRTGALGLAAGVGSASVWGCGPWAPRIHAAPGRSGGGLSLDEYMDHDGLALAERVRRREVTARELLGLAVERMERVNGLLNAVVLTHLDRAESRSAAFDEQASVGSPFAGVPFLLKDLHLQLAGTRTTNGSRLFAERVAERSSTLVGLYEKAGLVVFGKTASPELGLLPTTESALHGATRNPWDPERTPGGSSGGSAAAVAAGIVPLANASDGGGSIRIPASCCGLFGMKPSRGRTPLGPSRGEGWNGLTHVHAVTRSVRDSAALLDATAVREPGSTHLAPRPDRPFLEEVGREPGRLRIALLRVPIGGDEIDPVCQAAVEDAARLAESLGHEVEEAVPRLPSMAFLQDALNASTQPGVARAVDERLAELGRPLAPDELEPFTLEMVEAGRRFDARAGIRARETFYRIGREMAAFHERFDVVLCSTLGQPPIEVGRLTLQDPEAVARLAPRFTPFTFLFNVTGQPSMSVPLYWTEDGLPIGTMWSGRYGDEATLFRLAAQLETARPWWSRRPERAEEPAPSRIGRAGRASPVAGRSRA
ncbi:MAG TPA: amidase [Myxococcota bacterium]|nr:amidase [Myxococcota bacterium]